MPACVHKKGKKTVTGERGYFVRALLAAGLRSEDVRAGGFFQLRRDSSSFLFHPQFFAEVNPIKET